MFLNMFKDILWKDQNIIKSFRMYTFREDLERNCLYFHPFLYLIHPL